MCTYLSFALLAFRCLRLVVRMFVTWNWHFTFLYFREFECRNLIIVLVLLLHHVRVLSLLFCGLSWRWSIINSFCVGIIEILILSRALGIGLLAFLHCVLFYKLFVRNLLVFLVFSISDCLMVEVYLGYYEVTAHFVAVNGQQMTDQVTIFVELSFFTTSVITLVCVIMPGFLVNFVPFWHRTKLINYKLDSCCA